MNRFVVIALAILLIAGCKKEKELEGVIKEYEAMPDTYSTTGMTQYDYRFLVENSDHIDYMFYDLPLSMNQDGQGHVAEDMKHISSTPAEGIPLGCKPLARKIYLGNGEIIMEADLYFGDGCYVQVFLKDQKPVFGNLLTTAGAEFYGNLLIQIEEEKQVEIDRQLTEKGFPKAEG